MTDMPSLQEVMEFPCDHLFKAFGPGQEGERFAQAVHRAVSTVVAVPVDALKVRPSSKGNYVCVSVLVRLASFDQLKEIYAALRGVEGITYLL